MRERDIAFTLDVRRPRVRNPTFADRHIGPNADEIAAMLAVIGVDSLDDLAAKALPAGAN